MALTGLDKKEKAKRDAVVDRVAKAGKAYKTLVENAGKYQNDDSKKQQFENERKQKILDVVPDIPVLLYYYPGYDYPKTELITLILDAYNQYMIGPVREASEQEAQRYDVPDVKYLQENRSIIRGKIKAGGKALANMNKKFATDRLTSPAEKDAQRRALVKSYEPEIKEFLKLYPNRDYTGIDSSNLNIMLAAYDKYKTSPEDSGVLLETGILSEIQSRAFDKENMKQDGSENPSKPETMGNISPAQQNGIREIAMWLYRNSTKTGMISLAPSQERFVRVILNLPARTKLYMYYLVENKKRHNPSMEDMIMSQTDYIPNVNAFKDQMVASKWKTWKRLDGSFLYWKKLEEALQIARASTDMLSMFGMMGAPDTVERLNENTLGAAGSGTGAANAGTADNREQILYSMMINVSNYKKMLAEKEEGKDVEQSKLSEAKDAIIQKYDELVQADEQIKAEEDFSSSGWETTKSYSGTAGSVIGLGSQLSSVGSAASLIKWNIAALDLKNLNLSAGIFSSVAGTAALLSALAGIVNLCRSAKEETAVETADKVMTLIQSFAGIASTATSGAYTIKNMGIIAEPLKGTAEHAAKMAATKASGVMNIVAGGIDCIAGESQMMKAEAQRAMAFEARRGMGHLEGKEKDNANEITALQERIYTSRASSGAMKSIAGALKIGSGILALGGVTGPVSTILSGIASGISLAISVKEYFEKKRNRITTIDTYIKMDEIESIVRQKLIESGTMGDPVNLRKQIRAEVIACLGFSSEESFYTHITRVYARFLIEKAFYEDGKPIIADGVRKPEENSYAKMIRSFGLKIVYPSREGEEPKPDIDTLAKKMNI